MIDEDRRLATRRRTRLRTGKLYGLDGTFLQHCRLVDRNALGIRIHVPAEAAMPRRCWFFDDEQQMLWEAEVIWMKGSTRGLKLVAAPHDDPLVRAAFGGRFYTLGASTRMLSQ
jgi:hypothetical protein